MTGRDVQNTGGSALSPRVAPANIPAEQALLGAILSNNRAFDRVSAFLRGEHFIDPVNGRIYDAIATRIDSGRLADVISLKADFENSGVLEEVGGIVYLAQLQAAMVGVINAHEYGVAIVDAWHRRQLIDIGETLVNGAYGVREGVSAKDVHEAAEEALYQLGEKGETEDASSPAHHAMALAIDEAVKSSTQPGGLSGLTTGYEALDDITGGWKPGQFLLLAARPSMGKTTLGLGIAVGAARSAARVLFISLEMTRLAIGAQLTAGLAEVARDAATRGKVRLRDELGRFRWEPVDRATLDKMAAAQRTMVRHTLTIDECRSGTVGAIRAAARRAKRRGGLDLIVIDYLGIMKVPELARFDNRTLEVTRISAGLKALARDLSVPVLALAQLNRGPEGRDDKRPSLADLRDSGSLEQDADTVMFIYREHYYLSRNPPKRGEKDTAEQFADRSSAWCEREAEERGKAQIIVAKQRAGRVGTVALRYDDESTWFHDIEGER